ncbi:MAG: acetylglutamate kinase [Terriglobia bacterium]
MKLVVKIGGQAAEDAKTRRNVARQIAGLRSSGHDVLVAHGGGKRLTQVLGMLGIPSEFSNGLRVTDAAARDAALMVLAGMVNKQWVAELESAGQPAIGLCGGDGKLVEARKLTVRNGARDLGYVGRPCRVNTAVVEMAFERRMVPVVASLGLGLRGEYFNINADDFAVALANALPAERLIYLTESGGVWDAERRLLSEVRVREIRPMIRKGVVRDGMIPKLLSCARVLAGGVEEIDMISYVLPDGLLKLFSQRDHSGTRIVK